LGQNNTFVKKILCWVWLAIAGFLLGYALLVRVSGAALIPAYVVYLWLLTASTNFNGNTQAKNLRTNQRATKVEKSKVLSWQVGKWQLTIAKAHLQAFVTDGLIVVAGALPTIALLLLHNYLRYGNFLDNGYDGEGFTTPIWEGFYGLLFSPGKSVFLYSPVLIAVIFAMRGFWQRFKPETILVSLILGSTILYYSMWWAWWGGSCWGPRFLVPILPFAILSVGVLLQQSRRWIAFICVGLFPLSLVVQILGVAFDFNVYTNSVTQGNPALDHLYIFDLDKSPLIAHWKMLSDSSAYTIRSLTLEAVGLNSATAQNLSPILVGLLPIATIFICYNYFRSMSH
jgi:hypothetical protein